MDKTVLVVEDDKATAGMIQAVLESEGYRVLHAVDGDGITVALTEQPGVILLDINMPGLNGPEVSQRLRAAPDTASIPIIGMSASQQSDGAPPNMVVDDWLPKPFPLDDLSAKVAQWIAAR